MPPSPETRTAMKLKSLVTFCTSAVLAAAAVSSYAQNIEVPAGVETTSGVPSVSISGQTYQVYIDPTQLAAFTAPQTIYGLRLRASIDPRNDGYAPAWPPSDITLAQYDIELSRASAAIRTGAEIASTATSFAQNQAFPITLVRSGPLTIPARSYPIDANATPASPNPFGAYVGFDTPYVYTPGEEILVTIRATGADNNARPFYVATRPNEKELADAVFASSAYAKRPAQKTGVVVMELVTTPVKRIEVEDPMPMVIDLK